jgi:hypothetical protein
VTTLYASSVITESPAATSAPSPATGGDAATEIGSFRL